jgi:hypothetical protein
MFTASRTAMVYQAHRNRSRLVWFDRAGKELGAIGKQEAYFSCEHRQTSESC